MREENTKEFLAVCEQMLKIKLTEAVREGYLKALEDVWKIVETANIGDPLTYGKFIEELIELKSCVSSSEASRAGKEGDKC